MESENKIIQRRYAGRRGKISAYLQADLQRFVSGCMIMWVVIMLGIGMKAGALKVYAEAVTAAEMANYPGVTVSPNGKAWTTDYMNREAEHLHDGYTIFTGVQKTLPDLKPGEHYYEDAAEGSIRIGKWVVKWSNAQCIHTYGEMDYMGYHVEAGICGKFYNNGWYAYCADCEEPVYRMLMYGRSHIMQGITSMPARSTYLYICPHCRGLEQGTSYQHICKKISANRYSIRYEKNEPVGATVTGYMQDTHHLYDNASHYEGLSASEAGCSDTRLRKNSYETIGYVFQGWNTSPDGSGQYFSDGEAVRNLSGENGATVLLYAQWRKCSSTLIIDPAGGTYQGQSLFQREDAFGKTYRLDEGLLQPAKGYLVQFVSNGGSAPGSVTTEKKFSHWEGEAPLSGFMKENEYEYGAVDGAIDRVRVCYINQGFTLPDSQKKEASLAGWYSTPDFKENSFVGKPGDEVRVDEDVVLYAKWVQLTLWAYDDYESHGGRGAVDLKWEQKDGKSKFYKLYQSEDANNWKELHMLTDGEVTQLIEERFTSDKQGETYRIPAAGYYTLTAAGAKGGDYSAALPGGAGGRVTATYWLQKGDVITAYAGGRGESLAGGKNSAGAIGGAAHAAAGRGGGAGTLVYLTRQGTRQLLMIAGGGGGASEKAAGGKGGINTTAVGSMQGISGAYGGGGGGAVGGTAGVFLAHYHEGNAQEGGGCYVQESSTKVCGTAYEAVGQYWECICGATWGIYSDGYYKQLHAACGEFYLMGPVYQCSGCNMGLSAGQTHRISSMIYVLGCTYKDQPNGYIIGAEASLGGSNYINTSFGCKDRALKAGENSDNGYVSLLGKDIGYREETSLSDVAATDKAAPGKITGVHLSLVQENQLKVRFARPDDYGTKYYHQAKSYRSDDSLKHIADSNVTQNVLTTGVAGYYYLIDSQSVSNIGPNNSRITEEEMVISRTPANQYLHIAAVDHAGNIGPVTHISLSIEAEHLPTDPDYPKTGKLFTRPLALEESPFSYTPDGTQYYVKADGITSHLLLAEAYMNQSATKEYQIDSIRFSTESGERKEWMQITTPHGNPVQSEELFGNESLSQEVGENGFESFIPVSSTSKRSGHGGSVNLEQTFCVQSSAESFYVYPQALAELKGAVYVSEQALDRSNGLTIIPDGEAPVIEGLRELSDFDILDMTEEKKTFSLKAYDTCSGLEEFQVTVTNGDNWMERTFQSDSQGIILLEVDKEDPLFLGELEISAIAKDRVGNVNESGGDGIAFTLAASVVRERDPEITVFKAGDGGVLSITTTGYADKVEVTFPEIFLELNPECNQEYLYEYPFLEKIEKIHFHVPLEATEQTYEITVRAWKNDRMLTDKPALVVVEGTVLDEIRTRIRNNR